MKAYRCPKCGSDEFVRLEQIVLDSNDKTTHIDDSGFFKCANCQQRVLVEPNKTVTPIETSTTVTIAPTARVRSSVTAEERGVGRVGPQDQFYPARKGRL